MEPLAPNTLLALALLGLTALQEPVDSGPRPERPREQDGWLVRHQEPDGSWDADGFARHDRADDGPSVAGSPERDVAVTSLALLALLAHREPTREDSALVGALGWLAGQCRPDTGRIGVEPHALAMHDHGLAALALCEARRLGVAGPDRLDASCRAAVACLLAARGDGGGWSAGGDPRAPADALTTGWATLGLLSAREAGIAVPREALDGAAAWWARHIDAATGRVTAPAGSGGTRLAPTAMGLLCRLLTGANTEDHPELERAADALVAVPPAWTAGGAGTDPETWALTTFALYRVGGERWTRWSAALRRGLSKGLAAGPAPVGPFGAEEGSVASTAYAMLSAGVCFRWSQLLLTR